MAPFLFGLGVPRFAAFFVDRIRVDLDISCEDGVLKVVDTTWFGTNTTQVKLGDPELEKSTRTGRKKFMMSGYDDGGRLTVQCRLFQRGDGWFTQQGWELRPDGTLQESMILRRPGEEDIVVLRTFERVEPASSVVVDTTALADARNRHSGATKVLGAGALTLLFGAGVAIALRQRTDD